MSENTYKSIIRNIAINLARKGGYDSLTKAERFLAHDIDKLFLLLEWIIPAALELYERKKQCFLGIGKRQNLLLI